MSLQATKMKRLNEEADRIIKSLSQTDAEAPAGATEQEVEVTVAAPDAKATSEQENTGAEVVSANNDAGVQVTDSKPEQDEIAKYRAEAEEANQRWRSLQGMIDKVNADNEALRGLIRELTEQLKDRKAEPAKEEAAKSFVTKKDEEEYGSEMIDLVRRVAKEIVLGEVSTLDTRFAEVSKSVEQVGKVAAKSAADRFKEDLTKMVPDWNQVNLDPEFSNWLGAYGLQALNAAYNDMNLDATAKFFKDFKVLTGKVEQPAAPAPKEPPSKKLEQLASPGKAKSSPQNPDAVKGRMWNASDVKKLYEDQRKKLITPEQFRTLEADLFKAQSDGRFVR